MSASAQMTPPGDLVERGVYFYLHDKPFSPEYFHFASATLAEGLKALGIPVYSNIEDPLFDKLEKRNIALPLFVFNVSEPIYSPALMDTIAAQTAPQKVIVSVADSVSRFFTPPGIPALMAHANRFYHIKQGLRYPWGIGINRRRIAATANGRPFAERENKLLCNFTPSHLQDVRRVLQLALIPHLEKYFTIDYTLSSSHNEKLRSYQGCLAYGGFFFEDLSTSHLTKEPSIKELLEKVEMRQKVVTLRWDSWRFWESLCAGCLTFNLDLEAYGLDLPAMPTPWVHYIPISLSDPKGTVERLMDCRAQWGEIAEQGKVWALAHYRPEAVAQRLIDLVASNPWNVN